MMWDHCTQFGTMVFCFYTKLGQKDPKYLVKVIGATYRLTLFYYLELIPMPDELKAWKLQFLEVLHTLFSFLYRYFIKNPQNIKIGTVVAKYKMLVTNFFLLGDKDDYSK